MTEHKRIWLSKCYLFCRHQHRGSAHVTETDWVDWSRSVKCQRSIRTLNDTKTRFLVIARFWGLFFFMWACLDNSDQWHLWPKMTFKWCPFYQIRSKEWKYSLKIYLAVDDDHRYFFFYRDEQSNVNNATPLRSCKTSSYHRHWIIIQCVIYYSMWAATTDVIIYNTGSDVQWLNVFLVFIGYCLYAVCCVQWRWRHG